MPQEFHDIQVTLNALLSGAIATIYKLIKGYMDPPPDQVSSDPIPLPPEYPGRDWKQEYRKLYARATELLRVRDSTKSQLEDQLFRTRDEVLERRAILKLTLYSGLVFALGSCVATVISPPKGAGATPRNSATHFVFLEAVYFVVALIFAFGALVHNGRPRRQTPILMFGVAAVYVNSCALLISIPYTLDLLFAAKTTLIFGIFPLGVWVGISRLVLEPFAAIVGSVVGTIAAGAYLRGAQQAANTAP